jgi:glycerol-3-phosphate O-acyltransferase
MRKIQFAMVALSSALLLASAGVAAAQQSQPKKQKITKEEAWSRCAAEVSKIASDHHSQRYSAGAACMLKYGYKI